MTKNLTLTACAVALAAAPLMAGPEGRVVGDYVEARTAEVFVGGCQLGNEGEAAGRQAVMAWHVSEGQLGGVRLDGLSVVAAIAADTNLGYYELGGRRPATVKAALMVDRRADAAQQAALVDLARSLSKGLVSDVVELESVPISFTRDARAVRVSAGEARLDVSTKFEHDPNCGAMQWYSPLAAMQNPSIGVTRTIDYSGAALGTRWEQRDRKSAFYGTFVY
jgi:hypothetical protein